MKKHFKNGFRYFKVTLFRPKHFGPLKQHPCSHLSENAEDAQNLLKKSLKKRKKKKKKTIAKNDKNLSRSFPRRRQICNDTNNF